MEAAVLILCVVISFAIGWIPVKWSGNIKQLQNKKNREYLDHIWNNKK